MVEIRVVLKCKAICKYNHNGYCRRINDVEIKENTKCSMYHQPTGTEI